MSTANPAMRVDTSAPTARVEFIRRTYLHVALAIAAFAALEWLLLQWSGARDLANLMTGGYSWLIVLLAFMIVSRIADHWARSSTSIGLTYLGLGLFVIAEAILFLPLLYRVSRQGDDVLRSAGLITALMVVGLTAVVVLTRTDFSFLRTALTIGGFVALGLIVASIVFDFGLGIVFAVAMVAFASGSILYNTSNIMRTYRTDQPVAAALSLFSSIALLFWYVVSITSRRR
jgi:FtsH-binding integral membrane protein